MAAASVGRPLVKPGPRITVSRGLITITVALVALFGAATFAVTSTAELGALFDTPALPGAVDPVLGVGAVVRRPVVVDAAGEERMALRSMAYLVLTYDHRLGDGGEAARYLSTVKNRLQGWDEAALEAVLRGAWS